MAVPQDMAGRPVRCPHCREISIAPTQGPSPIDQLEFSKPPEAADSILSEPDASDDSVFGDSGIANQPAPPEPSGHSSPARMTPSVPAAAQASFPMPPIVPVQTSPASSAAAVATPPLQPMYPPSPMFNGYPPGQPMMPAAGYAPIPPQPMYYPQPQIPPPVPESHPLEVPAEQTTPRRNRPASAPLPVKEIVIGCLATYSLIMTIVAILGWTRSLTPPRPVADPPKKTTKGSTR